MICLHHESSLSAQPHLYCVRAWMRFFSLTDRRTLCYLFKEFVGYRARKKADYQHTNIIVWINCLSLTATPLCYLSVCERQLIRTKVRMDSSLSAQSIASSLSANWNSFTHQVQFTNTLCEWIVFRWQSHRYVICLSAKGNWFAQRLGWAIVCQRRSRSPHLLICVQILTSLRPLRTLPGMHLIKK